MRLDLPYLRRMVSTAVVGFLVIAGIGSVAVTQAGPSVPKQFYRPLGQVLTVRAHGVVAVAHNAGNNAATARRAIQRGAAVIEIDVQVHGGQLFAAHDSPDAWYSRLAWRFAPPLMLDQAWAAARPATFVQLDLKSSSPEMVSLLLAFLDERKDDENWIVSSPDLDVLQRITDALPGIDTVLSIGSRVSLDRVLDEPGSLGALSGVSVRARLLDQETVSAFHEFGLFVLAWTVDDLSGLGRMLAIDIDAISTNNLAIIERLSDLGNEPVPFWNWRGEASGTL